MGERDWRELLRKWFQMQNQLWVKGEAEALLDWVADEEAVWIREEEGRWRRVRKQQQERKVDPLKGESRLRVLKTLQQNSHQLQVWVRSEERNWYRLHNELWEQEEADDYRFDLVYKGDLWKIANLKREKLEQRKRESEERTEEANFLPYEIHQTKYDRQRAVQYAELWWNSYNPRYRHFDVDCTNFVSQAIHAGGIPMHFARQRNQGWWYRDGRENWSYSWAVAHSLRNYLARGGPHLKATAVNRADQLQLGDIICYDWEGDGRWDHNTIVTAIDPRGMPLVNAHTVNSRRRYWDYRDSHAWREQTRYAFFHILDG